MKDKKLILVACVVLIFTAILFKSREKWNQNQKGRAKLIFELYTEIKKAYSLTHSLRMIDSHTETKGVAYTKLARWFNDVIDSGFKSFNTMAETVDAPFPNILLRSQKYKRFSRIFQC